MVSRDRESGKEVAVSVPTGVNHLVLASEVLEGEFQTCPFILDQYLCWSLSTVAFGGERGPTNPVLRDVGKGVKSSDLVYMLADYRTRS